MTYLNRSVDRVIEWGLNQIDNPSQDWFQKCQSFCRQSYGVQAWAGSAWEAWQRIPSSEKVVTSNPFRAPRGALIYYRGGQYGHVVVASGKSTNDKCLSNDYVRRGRIDKAAPRDLPRWGLTVVGWSAWTPFGSLNLDSSVSWWDGQVPTYDGCIAAWRDPSLRNPQAWRIACRLADWGFYSGEPQPKGVQAYPVRAVNAYQQAHGYNVPEMGQYGPNLHRQLWGVEP